MKEKIEKKDKKDKAAALLYDQTEAPRIVAKGAGEIARKMIEAAEAEGIPIQKNEVLVEALMQVELTKEIPPQLYRAVAEILAFIYRLDKAKLRATRSSKHT
ncbi:EscU/YscU/HrcU family type III secretion system export apparatus switch protein [Desulfosporosinus sp. BG]|uniref:EscU/YscU/HrcU family type III secretion system export apparatus switch protein n=1 Tax=Desulfosporosinus sp. BG TaxID=1633135 RepID=UPI00083A9CE4|nr:EscU/YscU/HrcU family type III secretion system export apparatus switch protein [Desulfosporosinus sp. BG]ODA39395.1 Flagellar biosynthesis protein FlhB [Desulfosporosinus sp. BG]